MPTDVSSMELYKNPEENVQEILRGIDALYPEQSPQSEVTDQVPSLFDAPESSVAEIVVIDFEVMAHQIAEDPAAHIPHVVRIGQGITQIREHFADAA